MALSTPFSSFRDSFQNGLGLLMNVMILVSMTGHIFLPLLKPLPIFLMIFWLVFMRNRAVDSGYHLMILCGLFFSITGDILLMVDQTYFFMGGILAFAIAHGFYGRGFYQYYHWRPLHLLTLFILFLFGLIFIILMAPYLHEMLLPVSIYLVVILTMGFFAIHCMRPFTGTGALLFILSDTLIAIHVFFEKIPSAGIWILSTYYFAQFLFLHSVEKKKK